VFVGDSAGGNFVVALTSLCIKYGVRPPNGIVPVYPALNLNLKSFTPSYLIALEDQILPHMFLKMCLNAYVDKRERFDPSTDPFISPIYASNEVFQLLFRYFILQQIGHKLISLDYNLLRLTLSCFFKK